jgi:hypothetical protein
MIGANVPVARGDLRQLYRLLTEVEQIQEINSRMERVLEVNQHTGEIRGVVTAIGMHSAVAPLVFWISIFGRRIVANDYRS